MFIHEPPKWMIEAPVIDQRCEQCGAAMRQADGSLFCLACWEWRTRMTVERCQALAAARQVQLNQAAESLRDDETQGYLFYAHTSAVDNNWAGVLAWKWRIAVLEMTGKRLPMQSYDEAA